MKSRLLLVAFIVTAHCSFTQTIRNFDFYNYDPKLINPAFAGLINEQNYQVQFRGDGMDYKYFPYTALTAFSTKLNGINSGIGAMAWHSRLGIYTENNASLLYNYQFTFGVDHALSIGTQVGFSIANTDYSKLGLQDPNDPLVSGNNTSSQFIVDFGIAYRFKKFSIGYSTVNWQQSGKADALFTTQTRYNYFTQYEFTITPWLRFQPSLFVQTTFKDDPIIDINGIVKIKELLLLGVTSEIVGSQAFLKYQAGVDIRKKLQILATAYDGVVQSYSFYKSGPNLQLMVRARIDNN